MVSRSGDIYVIYNRTYHKALNGEGEDGDFRLQQHISNLKKGIERNKQLQEDYDRLGKDAFEFKVVIKSIDRKLCESLLIELFSRLGMSYNKRDKSGERIRKIEMGELVVPTIMFKEIEDFIQQWKEKLPYYKELLHELEDMKAGFESKSENIYQREFKNTFLNSKSYTEESKRVAKSLFKKIAPFEEQLRKDLYDFSVAELRIILKSLGAKTIRSLQDKKSTIEQYINFAIEQGKSKNKVNLATAFDSSKKLEPLLDKEAEENMIFAKEEIMEMAMNSDNAQDGVILGLLFDGVNHKNEFEELTSLTGDNINDNQELVLEDRTIPISTETTILVRKALEEDVYVSIKGETTRKYRVAEGKNILRGLRGKGKVKGQIISQRILRISEIWDYKYLNATAISYSGQLHYAKELINKKNLSVDDSLPLIMEKFGIIENPNSRNYLKNRILHYLEEKGKSDDNK
jgi:hypothetical protein